MSSRRCVYGEHYITHCIKVVVWFCNAIKMCHGYRGNMLKIQLCGVIIR